MRTDVAIIGAGATGLSCALRFAQRGIRPVVVDKRVARSPFSRAFVLQARTLEVMEELGIVDDFIARGLTLDRNVVHDGRRRLVTIRLDQLPTKYPYTLVIPQCETEEILETSLEKSGTRVHRGEEMTGISQDSSGVTLTFASGQAMRADYVIGADGMYSLVREACEIGFAGRSYSTTFVLADLELDWEPPQSRAVIAYFSPGGPMALAPFPGGLYRVAAPVDSAPEQPQLADIERLLEARSPGNDPIRVRSVAWATRFRAHCCIASRYREGRVFLAGDSAHVHSPIFGHGMNIGIQEGVNIAGKLAAVLAGADPAILDSYEAQRRPIARRVLMVTDRGTRMVLVRSAAERRARAMAMRTLGSIPYLRRQVAMIASELAFQEK